MNACDGGPSSLVVQVANQFDMALVGFLRDDHFNIYYGTRHIAGLRRIRDEEIYEAAD
jgi:FdhD protein